MVRRRTLQAGDTRPPAFAFAPNKLCRQAAFFVLQIAAVGCNLSCGYSLLEFHPLAPHIYSRHVSNTSAA